MLHSCHLDQNWSLFSSTLHLTLPNGYSDFAKGFTNKFLNRPWWFSLEVHHPIFHWESTSVQAGIWTIYQLSFAIPTLSQEYNHSKSTPQPTKMLIMQNFIPNRTYSHNEVFSLKNDVTQTINEKFNALRKHKWVSQISTPSQILSYQNNISHVILKFQSYSNSDLQILKHKNLFSSTYFNINKCVLKN